MKNIKLFCVSLGCDKNLVDTEKMLGVAGSLGVTFTDDETEADAILVNTCCFIGDAKEESVNTILEMARYKEEGKCQALIVAGCLAQRYKQEITDEIPEVDAILGTTSYEEIGKVLTRLFGEQEEEQPYRSVPMEQLLEEARELADSGVRELILVAQETTLYGKDIYGEKSLPKLLHELAGIPGIYWIRIQYCYPEEITDELIEAIKSEEKVCRYLDIPIQHASDRILRRMGRRTHKEELKERIAKLRREIPDIALRTTLISGFPGETREDHEELMEFVNEMGFERLGVFAYSAEEDTPAYSYPDQVPQEIKEERRDAIMELQQEIAFDHCEEMVGRILTVMIEGKVADEPAYVGRTYMDAPNVDGLIFVNADEMLMSGDFVKVKVTGAAEYDLIGEVYHESAE